MTPRSIRRAQERKALKLARKAEKAAVQSGGVHPDSEPEASATHSPGGFLGEPSPEIYDEFSPELIAAANAERERIWRNARKALDQKRNSEAADPVVLRSRDCKGTAAVVPEPPARPASPSQLCANRANSQLSTGAKTPEGKQTISFNAFRHGLAGRFMLLASENENEFKELFHGLQHEHRPSTSTEHLLIEGMAQHWWLAQRALRLQQACFHDTGACENDKHLALYLRYQTTHDRAFHKCLNDLLKLRAQRRKEQIGFVSQQHKEADQTRRQARENRQEERHKWAVLLDQAKVDHQILLNRQLPGSEQLAIKAA